MTVFIGGAAVVLAVIIALATRQAGERPVPMNHALAGTAPDAWWKRYSPTESRNVASVHGRVTTAEDGTPIGKALVCVRCAGSPCPVPDTACSETATDGSYRLEGIPLSKYTGVCSARGYLTTTGPVEGGETLWLYPSNESVRADFHLKLGGAYVFGAVRSHLGEPLRDAAVQSLVDLTSGLVETEARTDASGVFQLWVGRERATVRAEADGFAPETVFARDLDTRLEIVLRPAATLEGVVVESKSLRPISGVLVDASPMTGTWMEEETSRTRTDADGRFLYSALKPGRYRPSVKDAGWFGDAAQSVAVGALARSAVIQIKVDRGFVVAGKVRSDEGDCGTGEISMFEVLLRGSHQTPVSDGVFLFETVPPGRYRFEIDCEGFVEHKPNDTVSVVDADVTELLFNVRRGHTISGRVLDEDDKPVPETSLTIRVAGSTSYRSADYAFSRDDGTFESSPLEPGRYSLRAGVGRFSEEVASQEVDLTEGPTTDVVVRVSRSGSIRGTVIDSSGVGVPGFAVEIRRDNNFLSLSLTDAGGRFAIDRFASGPASVLVSHPFGRFMNVDGELVDRVEEPFEAAPGETVEVTIRVGKSGGSLSGTVVYSDGSVAPFAQVTLGPATRDRPSGYVLARSRMLGGSHRWESTTGEDGRFRFDGLADNTYRLIGRSAEGHYGQVTSEPASDIRLTLQAPGSISGTVRFSDDQNPPYFSIRAEETAQKFSRSEVFRTSDGSWLLSGLPPGDWSLMAETPGGSARGSAVVEPGGAVEGVELLVQGRGAVVGRVVAMADTTPLANVEVGLWMEGDATGSVTGASEVRTGEDGRFKIDGVPTGQIRLRMQSPPGFVDFWGLYTFVRAGPDTDVGDIKLRKLPDPDKKRGMVGMQMEWPPKVDDPAGLVVSMVKEGSPAAQAGIAVGDTVVAVRGVSIAGSDTYLFWQLIRATEGEKIPLKLSDGRTVEIVAAAWTWE